MKKYSFILLTLFWALAVRAANIGTWNCFPAYGHITNIQPAGNYIYVLSSQFLYAYNTHDESITTYHKMNGLSDCGITHIAYCKSAKRLVIVYENQNIDLLDQQGNITNISSFYTKTISGKNVNSIMIDGDYAYLNTNFGIVKVNVAKAEISETYNLGLNILSSDIHQGWIYAITDNGIISADITHNLIDKNEWKKESDIKAYVLGHVGKQLYAVDNGNLYYQVAKESWQRLTTTYMSYTYTDGEQLIIGTDKYIYLPDEQRNVLVYDLTNKHNYIAYDTQNKCFWGDQSDDQRLFSFSIDEEKTLPAITTVTPIKTHINPDGPKNNDFCFIRWTNQKLYTVPGNFGFTVELLRPGLIQTMDSDGEWSFFGEDVAEKTQHDFTDINCIDVNPKNPSQIMAGGKSGLYEFNNGQFVREYNIENSLLGSALDNSFPISAQKNYTLVLGIKYDANGNLWIANSQSKTGNIFQLNTNGEMTKLNDVFTADEAQYMNYLKNMMIDSRGLIWMINTNVCSALCIDMRQNSAIIYDNFTNQDGTNYQIDFMRFVNEDKEGNIWLGTNAGLFVINSKDVNTGDKQVLQQIKVPRNDGTNYADYLLSGVDVTCMALDGANRKWIGTSNNGVYLVSADNYVQEQHFLADNSELLSNHIESITINPQSGEVFIATDKGLCSYLSNATEANEEMTSDNVYAYPNPVEPGYTGPITVVGLSYNADVKITTTNGVLVAQGRSNGGSFTWDGTDLNGHRVASGVYMVHTATADGKKGTVCKIAIVN